MIWHNLKQISLLGSRVRFARVAAAAAGTRSTRWTEICVTAVEAADSFSQSAEVWRGNTFRTRFSLPPATSKWDGLPEETTANGSCGLRRALSTPWGVADK